ncbi:helicase associated domain-containing protein, partial [Burkholderiaceae bacterium]|nr:helicase associated domain-containing protein [Burkholderiaceae bacterium]
AGWTWNPTEKYWEECLFELEKYVGLKGHALVPGRYVTTTGVSLGSWVNRLRTQRELLTTEQIDRLNQIRGWSWHPHRDEWEQAFNALQKYQLHVGDASPLASYVDPDGFRLGFWVVNQRVRKGRLSEDQVQRLQQLPGWVWDTFQEAWDKNFTALQEYIQEHKDALVPVNYVSPSGVKLGVWVNVQRTKYKKLPTDRFTKLDAMREWVWDVRDAAWQKSFRLLEEYVRLNGNALVSSGYATPDGAKLGRWVSKQRAKKSTLRPEYREKLSALPGWVWSVKE